MILGTNALVLQVIPFSDNSVIAKVYTEQRGLLSIVVKGARGGKRNRKAALLQTLNLLDISVMLRENRDLHYLREMRLLHPWKNIPLSLVKTSQALFIAELLRHVIREEEKNDSLFSFLMQALLLLDEMDAPQPLFHHKFSLELSRLLGFYPLENYDDQNLFFQFTDGEFHHSYGETCCDREDSYALYLLMKCGFENLAELKIPRKNRQQLLRCILLYYKWHMPGFKDLHTPEVLEEVFG
jgi:DNA repair protein RecO (recombination protein O)